MNEVTFSHGWCINSGSAAVVIDERPVNPMPDRYQLELAANDLIGWRGGWRYYRAGSKSAVSYCFVLCCGFVIAKATSFMVFNFFSCSLLLAAITK